MKTNDSLKKINHYLLWLQLKKFGKTVIQHFTSWHWYEYLYLLLFLIVTIVLIVAKVPNNFQIITTIGAISSSIMAIFKKPTCFVYGFFHAVFYAVVCFNQKIFSSFLIFGFFISLCELVGLFLWVKNTDNGVLKTQKLSWKRNLILFCSVAVAICVTMIFLNILEANWIHAFLDAFSSIMLAIGMTLMLTRFREQWFYWFAGDLLTMLLWIYLFVSGNHDYIMLVMSTIMVLLSLTGLIHWMLQSRKVNS